MSKWIKFEKSSWGLSGSIVILNTICIYAGKTDHWGVAAAVNFYDRSISLEIFNLFMGVEIWHRG